MRGMQKNKTWTLDKYELCEKLKGVSMRYVDPTAFGMDKE
jgi:hypothetical protein